MSSSRPNRRVRAVAGAFATLLAIALLAPTPARAGCQHPGDRPALGLDAGLDRPDGPLRAADQAPAPKPCSGPSCSDKPAPTPTSAPTPPPPCELWGLAATRPPLDSPGSTARATVAPPARPLRLASPLFRPPRSPR